MPGQHTEQISGIVKLCMVSDTDVNTRRTWQWCAGLAVVMRTWQWCAGLAVVCGPGSGDAGSGAGLAVVMRASVYDPSRFYVQTGMRLSRWMMI